MTLPDFVAIGQTVKEIQRFLDFSKWPFATLVCCVHLDHPKTILGLYCCARCGFEDTHFSMLCAHFGGVLRVKIRAVK